jgi:hypothetical protein
MKIVVLYALNYIKVAGNKPLLQVSCITSSMKEAVRHILYANVSLFSISCDGATPRACLTPRRSIGMMGFH